MGQTQKHNKTAQLFNGKKELNRHGRATQAKRL